MDYLISPKERDYLRELARQQLELSRQPSNRAQIERWYLHNESKGSVPMVILETRYCEDDLYDLCCESEFAREIELELKRSIVNEQLIRDDKVVPDYYTLFWLTNIKTLDLDMSEHHVKDATGKSVGYTTTHHLEDLENDFGKIGKTIRTVDKPGTLEKKEAVESIIGDILPVRLKDHTQFFNWYASPSKKVVYLMGMEAMLTAPYDCPDEFKRLYEILTDDALETYRWMSDEGILCLNNGNDYAGAGSYGFSRLLPTRECLDTGRVTTKDLWLNINSQETLSMSPAMFGEFIFPSIMRIAREFGQVYYGCCEPAHQFWDKYISTLPNLRKVSISPWCDEEYMGERLRGGSVIYSRKPSPNYLGVQREFDREAFREHIAKSVRAARGCRMEIICRDVYALNGNREKLGEAVEVMRQVIEDDYQL